MQVAQRLNPFLRRIPVWPIYALAFVPPVWLLWQAANGSLGVDPVKALEHRLGELALQLIVAVLAITPLRRYAGLSLLRFRRALGVVSFAYVVLHFLCWLVLDMGLLIQQAAGDVLKRPYITLGAVALLLMVPLALTSNDWSVRRLGAARWSRLHRLTYPAAILAALHYLWLVKAWPVEPIAYLGAILALLALRKLPRAPAARAAAQLSTTVPR